MTAPVRTPRVSIMDVMSRDLLAIEDDVERHAAIIARAEQLAAEASALYEWADGIRRQYASRTSERRAAEILGVSRATVQKAKSRKR